ncbi:MAG TPA: ORF6N domain-containing protein [Gelidibacter sp.]|uniref:ORF6N domain-containing protein n=1 Tax=Gelidibacter sp. TaxID=2018083 RepID=UPI002C48A19C|nr:ORF6N domain-containing protein [Gelidibacter sp.]HXJ97800.1 ORF6N domain-containing protein [Gelidibacter sp.]
MKPQEIENKIYEIRHQNVMLDFDLAEMYQIETRVLKQAVRRNLERFPKDFMFELTEIEIESMVSQNVIPSKQKLGGAKPFAFTEQGVAMLSSVLKSKIAIEINISIIRTFVLMRQYALSHKELSEKLSQLENKYDEKFNDVAEALNFLLQKDKIETEQKQRKPIGYKKQ